jgi:hypothetical protein
MRRFLRAVALGVGVAAVVSMSGPAMASGNPGCDKFRQSIVDMESGSVRPPGWFNLDSYLRLLYQGLCLANPTLPRTPEYWFRADGTPTGVPSTEAPPADAAYATTEEIGRDCAGTDPGNPGMCALLRGAAAACAAPRDERQRKLCVLLNMETGPVRAAPKGDELPPLTVGLDGGPYRLDRECLGVLTQFGDDLVANAKAEQRQGWLETMQAHCPDLLAALERRTGANAQGDPGRFWPAFGQILLSGFAPAGRAAPASVANVAEDPDFQRMCTQADANMRTCEQRLNNMRSVGTKDTGVVSQAGAFNDCRLLYGQVLNMCRASGVVVQPAQSAMSDMSPKCQTLVKGYIAAAQAQDGPRSVAYHNALKQAGGCGVLSKVEPQQAGSGGDPRFVARASTPLLDGTVGACDQLPDECAERVRQLAAGTSPEAVAAMYSNAIGIGLSLGSMMGSAVMSGVPSGPNTDMRSLAPGPVRGTYGQGSPVRPAPPNSQSTITGLGR